MTPALNWCKLLGGRLLLKVLRAFRKETISSGTEPLSCFDVFKKSLISSSQWLDMSEDLVPNQRVHVTE